MFNLKGVATPSITIEKFSASIRFELLDAPDMYQYSHSLVFDDALPTNLRGPGQLPGPCRRFQPGGLPEGNFPGRVQLAQLDCVNQGLGTSY
ncbi:MAG: hypothetical protein IID14_07795 [Candidatus Marinimicrobia bacterium]|nr:hypothetical protein [Candidatus Neomarinimicrobiota bacterium]